MLTEIEEAVLTRLITKIEQATNIRIDDAESNDTLNRPSVEVIVSGAAYSRVAQTFKCAVKLAVVITVQNLRSVRDGRRAIYPIIEAAVASLATSNLGIGIDPMKPVRADNVSSADDISSGRVVFQLEFDTAFIVEPLTEAQIDDLIRIGLNYYLTVRDDEDVDAQDLVTLT